MNFDLSNEFKSISKLISDNQYNSNILYQITPSDDVAYLLSLSIPCESYEIIEMIVATTKSQSEISLMQDVGSNQ